jgi:hypothetical protein
VAHSAAAAAAFVSVRTSFKLFAPRNKRNASTQKKSAEFVE